MLFTEGKDRYYERLMTEKPHYVEDCEPPKKKVKKKRSKKSHQKNYKNQSGKNYHSRFKYRYEDLNCGFCLEADKKPCPYSVCPHIMDNLDDLICDCEFLSAVANAKNCETPHKSALLKLQKSIKTIINEGVCLNG